MFSFTDKTGTAWNFQITLATARFIDSSDFSSVLPSDDKYIFIEGEREFFQEVLTNVQYRTALLWAILIQNYGKDKIKEILKAPSLEEAEIAFIDRLDGKALKNLKIGLCGALADFFQDQATALSMLLRKEEQVAKMMEEEMKSMEPLLDKKIAAEISKSRREAEKELGEISS